MITPEKFVLLFCDKLETVSGFELTFYIDGLVQNCSNYIVNELELHQACIKPSVYWCNSVPNDNILVHIDLVFTRYFIRQDHQASRQIGHSLTL